MELANTPGARSSRVDRSAPSRGKCALVTGASKGVGRGIALGLAEAGWSVGVNYHGDKGGADETVAAIREGGGIAWVFRADVGQSQEVQRMFAEFLGAAGRIDLLVNNAGVQTWAGLLDLKEEDWDRTIRTNLKGTFLCTQQAARIMRDSAAKLPAEPPQSPEQERITAGCIINIGSGANKSPFPHLVDYCASKGGIDRFTAIAAVELGPLGIRVNCVAPGAIEIERTQQENPDYARTWGAITPLGRVGSVHDVADAVVYLASDRASFISGQTLYVDGGMFSQVPWPYPD